MKEKKKRPLKSSKPLKRVSYEESIGYKTEKAMGLPPKKHPKQY